MKKIHLTKKTKISEISNKEKNKTKKNINEYHFDENFQLNEFINFKSIKLPRFKNFKDYLYDKLSKNIFEKMMSSWEKYARILNINPNKPKLNDFYDWLYYVYKMNNDFILQIKVTINGLPSYLKRAVKDFPDLVLSPEQLSEIFEQILIMEKKFILSGKKYNPSERKKEIANYTDVVSNLGISDKNQKTDDRNSTETTKNNVEYFFKNFINSSNISNDKKTKILDKMKNDPKDYIENILNLIVSKT